MADHPNAAIVRAGLEAMYRGDMDGASAMIGDDVEWHEIGAAEPVRGKAALAERMAGLGTGFDFSGEIHDVVGSDDHVVALVTTRATHDGRTFEYKTAEIFHVSDGKVTARWAFSDDTGAINEFFG